jgi:hypothetical protein
MIALLLGAALAASPAEAYAEGIAADRAGELPAAEGHFRAALEAGGVDADVYLGLGNVLYRQGQRPAAITAYVRGLWLDPSHPDLRANLDHSLSQTADRIEPPAPDPGPFFWAGVGSPRLQVWAAGLLAGLGLLRVGVRRHRGQRALDGAGLVPFFASLLLAVGVGALSAGRPPVVVGLTEVSVRSAPTPGSVEVFVLHAGAVVAVEEEAGEQTLVVLPDGRKGWLMNSALMSADPGAPFPAVEAGG